MMLSALTGGGKSAEADVGGVTSNTPTFGPGQPMTITISAEDDDGLLTIISNLPGSNLTVTGCTAIGTKVAGKCDVTGMTSVSGQGTVYITVDTDALDADDTDELLTVTLTLTASCATSTAVTIDANQPGNVGPDNVTVNCIPPTPTPSPTATATATATPTRTSTPVATSTPAPLATSTPLPPPPQTEVLTTVIKPPSTGDAGLSD